MKKAFMIACLLLMCVLMGGCSKDLNKKEINQIDMIRVLAIDYKDNQYQITALYGIGGADTVNGDIKTAEGEGATLFEAFENLKEKNRKNISLAYTGFYLLGQGLVDQGVEDTIQFLIKDETVKINALMYIVSKQEASNVISDAMNTKNMIQDDLNSMVEKRLESVTRNENTILWLYDEIEDHEGSTIIPYFTYEDSDLEYGGYAALYDGKLVAYLDKDTSLGVDLFRGIVKSCPIYLDGGYGIMINNVKTQLTPSLQSDSIKVEVKLQFDSVLRSVADNDQNMNKKVRNEIKKEQTAYMINLLEQAVSVTQTIHVDVFALSDVLQRDKVVWQALDGHHDEFLQFVKYHYNIQSRLTRSSVLEGWR